MFPVPASSRRRDSEAVLRTAEVKRTSPERSFSTPAASAPPSTPPLNESAGSMRVLHPVAERHCVGCFALEPVALARPREDLRSSASACVSPASSPASSFIRPWGADHRELRQVVVAPDLVVGRVVRGGDLERAVPKAHLDALVRDHRHAALDARHHTSRPTRGACTARRPGARDGDVAEDGRRADGHNRDVASRRRKRIAHVAETHRRLRRVRPRGRRARSGDWAPSSRSGSRGSSDPSPRGGRRTAWPRVRYAS